MGKGSSRYDTVEIDGQKLLACRKQRRLTQTELANLTAGISRGYVSIMETSGTVRVGRNTAERLTLALNVGLQDLSPDKDGVAGPPAKKSRTAVLGAPLRVTDESGHLVTELREALHTALDLVKRLEDSLEER